MLCATMAMTMTVGVDLVFSFKGFFLGCFLLILYHIAAKIKTTFLEGPLFTDVLPARFCKSREFF